MARYDKLVSEDLPERKDPRAHARQVVLRHAEEMVRLHEELEEQIAVVGSQLDNLKAAREIIDVAMRGTEKLRASIRREDEPELELDSDDDNLVRR